MKNQASVPALVTPAVMKWARETAGMSFADVAKRFPAKKITEQTVKIWESGKKLKYSQLEELAHNIYKRPVAVFFFPHPPKENNIEKKMRFLSNAKSLPPKIHFLVRKADKAEVFQMNLYELHDRINPAPQKIFSDISISPTSSMLIEAKQVRDYLDFPITPNQKIDKALKKRRSLLEKFGISVFKDSFEEYDFSGFCLHDEQFPIIYLNNNMSKQRQSFTMFHELAHILMKTGGVDFRSQNSQPFNDLTDIACNQFASEVLVPSDSFAKYLSKKHAQADSVQKLAHRYSVSREVILRKFLDNKIINREYYNKQKDLYDKEWIARRDKEKEEAKRNEKPKGGSFYDTHAIYISATYEHAVSEKYHSKQINEYQFADYMNLKLSQIDKYRNR